MLSNKKLNYLMTGLKADVNASNLALPMFIIKTIPQGVLYQSYIKNFIKNSQGVLYQSYIKNFIKNSMKGKMILL